VTRQKSMPKRPIKQQNHSWAVYHIKIAKAIEEYDLPQNLRDRLMARQRQ